MLKDDLTKIGLVYESAPNLISIKIKNDIVFEKNKSDLQIGKYLQIEEGNHNFILVAIKNIKVLGDGEKENYIINTQPIGLIEGESDYEFKPGGVTLPSPTECAYLPSKEILNTVFEKNETFSFELGNCR